MSDALPLPPRPNLEQYRKLAKDLQDACKSKSPEAIRNWATRWVKRIARLQGLDFPVEVQKQIDNEAAWIDRHWRQFKQNTQRNARCRLTDAQFFVARIHGFLSWPKFVSHLKALERTSSRVSKFEVAVDAIVNGDLKTMAKLLREDPKLVHARSTRSHRSTLLHYVSANGVEDFRQKTPKNIVQIAKLLIESGADVNAESDAYGGGSTTLGLTATSYHPEKAGVQRPLMELLIDHGAIIDGPDSGSAVIGCLHNGRGGAAEFFAKRGARLDLEGAAGVGRLDIVKSFFNEDGSLKPTATQTQMKDGFTWACEFGRTEVVAYLLEKGIEVNERIKHHGGTGLHWAAYGGHAKTIKLLLNQGAFVDVKDESFGGTPLDWALYAWGNSTGSEAALGDHYEVVSVLVNSGAKIDTQWYAIDEERRFAVQNLKSDRRMQKALAGAGDKLLESNKPGEKTT